MGDNLWFSFQAWDDNKNCISWIIVNTDITQASKLWEDFKNTHRKCWKLKFFLQLDERFHYTPLRDD